MIGRTISEVLDRVNWIGFWLRKESLVLISIDQTTLNQEKEDAYWRKKRKEGRDTKKRKNAKENEKEKKEKME